MKNVKKHKFTFLKRKKTLVLRCFWRIRALFSWFYTKNWKYRLCHRLKQLRTTFHFLRTNHFFSGLAFGLEQTGYFARLHSTCIRFGWRLRNQRYFCIELPPLCAAQWYYPKMLRRNSTDYIFIHKISIYYCMQKAYSRVDPNSIDTDAKLVS